MFVCIPNFELTFVFAQFSKIISLLPFLKAILIYQTISIKSTLFYKFLFFFNFFSKFDIFRCSFLKKQH